jgi:hypothetical protein
MQTTKVPGTIRHSSTISSPKKWLLPELAGMWREKVDQHNTGSVQYERIERVIVEHTSDHAALSDDPNKNTNKAASHEKPSTTHRYWSA